MRGPFFFSVLFHVVVVALSVMTLPKVLKPRSMEVPPMVVDLVMIEEVSKAPEIVETSEPEKLAKKREAEEKKDQTLPEAAPPPPPPPPAEKPKPEAVTPPKPELVPEVIKEAPPPKPVEAKPLPPPPPVPEKPKAPPKPVSPKVAILAPPPPPPPVEKPVEKKPKVKAPPPPEPVVKTPRQLAFARLPVPAMRPTPKVVKKFDPNRLMKLLKNKAPRENRRKRDKATLAKAKSSTRTTARVQLSNKLSIGETDAIRRQIERCWSVPAGARQAQDLAVRVRIFLNRDGSLARPPEVLDSARMERDSFFRTAAESAKRAVRACQPLRNMPQRKYEQWRQIVLTFDPKELSDG